MDSLCDWIGVMRSGEAIDRLGCALYQVPRHAPPASIARCPMLPISAMLVRGNGLRFVRPCSPLLMRASGAPYRLASSRGDRIERLTRKDPHPPHAVDIWSHPAIWMLWGPHPLRMSGIDIILKNIRLGKSFLKKVPPKFLAQVFDIA